MLRTPAAWSGGVHDRRETEQPDLTDPQRFATRDGKLGASSCGMGYGTTGVAVVGEIGAQARAEAQDAGGMPAGSAFGQYVIGNSIRRGGCAPIYRAQHQVHGLRVALEVLDAALLLEPDGHSRFLREAEAAAALEHPHVADITDVGIWQDTPYVVMELLEGEVWAPRSGRSRVSEEREVLRLLLPVAAALAAAHDAGIVHGDVRPSNIFLARGQAGEVLPKLLDFGISRLVRSIWHPGPSSRPIGERMGTPMYMSPETLRDPCDVTTRSDQYSFGVVLYECLTGHAPFGGEPALDASARGKVIAPRHYRPELSQELEAVVSRALEAEPGKRFESMQELGRALCAAADARMSRLWMPSFGPPPSWNGDATLPSVRIHADVPKAAIASSGPHRRRGLLRPALGALLSVALGALLSVAIAGRMSVSSRDAAEPQATSVGEATPLADVRQRVLEARQAPASGEIGTDRSSAGAARDAGRELRVGLERRAPSKAGVRTPPAARGMQLGRQGLPRSVRQRRAAPAAPVTLAPAPSLEAPPAALAATPPAPAFGANQSPILD